MKNKEYLQIGIKGKLSTVSMTKGRGCPGPYMKGKHREKAKCTRKHRKYSTRHRGHLPEGGNVGERLAQWGARLGEVTQWVPKDWVGCRATYRELR
jgi:hypothetical protein